MGTGGAREQNLTFDCNNQLVFVIGSTVACGKRFLFERNVQTSATSSLNDRESWQEECFFISNVSGINLIHNALVRNRFGLRWQLLENDE